MLYFKSSDRFIDLINCGFIFGRPLKMEFKMTLGKQIADARKAKKIGQKDIAEELGVTIQAVSQWERNKTIPSQINLLRLSNILGVEFSGVDMLMHIPTFAKQASYAPMVTPHQSLFYHRNTQNIKFTPDEEVGDYIDMAFPKAEMVPISWEPAGFVFAMKITDRSMAPQLIPGDVIIADSGIDPEPGDVVVGQVFPSPGGIVRRYRIKGKDEDGNAIIELVPLNQDFPTETMTMDKTGEITGCVREFRRIIKEK